MNTPFDRFIADHDGLAALLRALPPHTPPASMDAWFAHAAQQADAERAAANATHATLQFEAPATMAGMFAAAAAQAEQAQAAQRAAVQARLAQGDTADRTLGAPLSDAARSWVTQQTRNAADGMPMASGASEAAGASDLASAPGSISAPTSVGTSARRSSRRQRWLPPLALAASVTLAVGFGLQWQATRPVPDAPTPAAAVPVEAQPMQAPTRHSVAAGQDRATQSSLQSPALPAPASADEPGSAGQSAEPPPPSLQELAPAPMPAPMSAPLPERVLAPPAAAPAAELIPAESARASEAAENDAQPPMAPAPPPAPIAASNDEVQASGALEARLDSGAHAPFPAKRAPAATPVLLPAPSPDQSLRVERTAANASATNDIPLSRAAPLATPTAASALRRAQQVGKPQPEASRETPWQQPADDTAAKQSQIRRDEDRPSQTPGTTSLQLSSSPREWLARYDASGAQPPRTIRITAAKPAATAVRTWITQLRDQLTQHGWPTQIELIQDSSLAADELRLEPLGVVP